MLTSEFGAGAGENSSTAQIVTEEINIDGVTSLAKGGLGNSNAATSIAEGLSSTFSLLSETIDPKAPFKPVPGDSAVSQDGNQLMIGVKLKKGLIEGGVSPNGWRPVQSKEDSIKYVKK